MIKSPSQTIFFTIERAIKEYRKFAQRNLNKEIENITIDQALLLISLNNNPELSQNDISEILFKDNASITRMIELMTKKNYLKRSINNHDRRKYFLELTSKGKEELNKINTIIAENRRVALNEISEDELAQLTQTLNKLMTNCNYDNEI